MKLLFIGSIFLIGIINAREMYDAKNRFIHRQNFIEISDFVYSGIHSINPKAVFRGSIIFMAGDEGAHEFFKFVHPHIENPYIIIYYNGGLYGPILDDPKILHFFCAAGDGALKNNHPKYSYLPIGLFRFSNADAIGPKWFKELRKKNKHKSIYMNFTCHPVTPWRSEIYKFFKNKPFVTAAGKKDFKHYLQEMSDHKFTLSPSGDVFDCYRHWEAIAAGSIPIMLHSPIDPLFDGLPVLFVNSWNEVTEELLNREHNDIRFKRYNFEKIYMQYWIDRINDIKKLHNLL